MEKSIILKILLSIWRISIMNVENLVLAISYIFMASYYILLAIDIVA